MLRTIPLKSSLNERRSYGINSLKYTLPRNWWEGHGRESGEVSDVGRPGPPGFTVVEMHGVHVLRVQPQLTSPMCLKISAR